MQVQPLLDTGWARKLGEDSYELGPSCGLILSIVARRESLECAVVRPDGRMIPSDKPPSSQYEATKAIFMPRVAVPKGEYAGITPAAFVTKLSGLIKRCLTNRRSVADVGFAAVCIAWPGRIDHSARKAEGGRFLGDVFSYEQKAYGEWTVEDVPISLAGLVDTALGRAGFKGRRPPILVINDADAELLALANIPREERSPSEDEVKTGGPAARAAEVHERICGSRLVLSVTVAGGVGGALLVDGVLVRGQRGFTGELGEVPVDIEHGSAKKGRTAKLTKLEDLLKSSSYPRWECPHEETLDYWASGRSILDQLCLAQPRGSAYKKKATYTEELGVALHASDMEVRDAILKRAGRLIGLGVIGPVLMLDPGVVLVSSPLPSQPIADGIKYVLNEEIGEVNPDPDVVLAVDHDPTRLLKGSAQWAVQERVSPALERVCKAKSQNLAKVELDLTAWPAKS